MTAAERIRRRRAVAGHASALAVAAVATTVAPVLWIGTLGFLGPLTVVLAYGRRDPFVRAHASAALAFNLSLAAYLVAITAGVRLTAGSPYTIQFVPFFLFLNMLILFNWLVFTTIAMQRAGTGQRFSYPLTLPWISRWLSRTRPPAAESSASY